VIEDFLVRAALAGAAAAIAAGPLGAAMLWGRLAFFGDALAHAALLGVVVAVALDVDPWLGVGAVGVAVAFGLAHALGDPRVAPDAVLAIASHGTLAVGLVALGLTQGTRIDLQGYLFGDILAVGRADLAWAIGGAAVALAGVAAIWRPMVAVLVHADLAAVEGIPARWVRLGFLALLAIVVAVAMKTVGILLVTALLVLPAATARVFARTPEAMAAFAAAIGCVAVAGGLGFSVVVDAPSGPSIVCAAVVMFLVSRLGARR